MRQALKMVHLEEFFSAFISSIHTHCARYCLNIPVDGLRYLLAGFEKRDLQPFAARRIEKAAFRNQSMLPGIGTGIDSGLDETRVPHPKMRHLRMVRVLDPRHELLGG